ncbi:MAG: hypothetical protein ACI9W0_002230, partial [Gammaproteobacteria bacterium]
NLMKIESKLFENKAIKQIEITTHFKHRTFK